MTDNPRYYSEREVLAMIDGFADGLEIGALTFTNDALEEEKTPTARATVKAGIYHGMSEGYTAASTVLRSSAKTYIALLPGKTLYELINGPNA